MAKEGRSSRSRQAGSGTSRRRAEELARQQRSRRSALLAAGSVLLIVLGVFLIVVTLSDEKDRPEGPSMQGVRSFDDLSRNHVAGDVSYPQKPPVGGDHAPVPQTCGAYDAPVPDEAAVHSMEHGAVWIAYGPDLSDAKKKQLNGLASETFVLVSPYPGLRETVVASAWGRQLRLNNVNDPRLRRFVDAFRQGPQTPEPGAQCLGTAVPSSGAAP